MTRTAWFDGPLPRILAHRGLALDAPENGLDAFAAALAAGATHLETDVRATADGVPVLVHDPRLRDDGPAVAALPLAELRRLRPGTATLDEALEAHPAARFNIDLKAASAVAPAVRAIRRLGAADRVLVTSFSTRRRGPAVRALGPVATSASASQVVAAVLGVRLRSTRLVRAALHAVDAVQLPERIAGLETGSPAVLARFHDAGVEVHVWTVNDPARMRALVAAGVDGIVTDRTDLAVRALLPPS